MSTEIRGHRLPIWIQLIQAGLLLGYSFEVYPVAYWSWWDLFTPIWGYWLAVLVLGTLAWLWESLKRRR